MGTNEMICYFSNFKGIASGTLLHYYLINFVVNSHLSDPEQSLINGNLIHET